jgi:SulP family sulfate permease
MPGMPAQGSPLAALRSLQGWLLPSLRGYQSPWLRADALAGLTLLAIAIPEQLATSRLAVMPPITGLYAFVAGTVAFAFLGSSPTLSSGADSTIAPLFAVGVAGIAASGSPRYVQLVAILSVMVGVLVAIVAIARLGWISEFLSAPIISGFLAGVAVVIVVHQLPDLLGITSTNGSNLHRIRYCLQHLGSANGWAVGIGLAVFATILGLDRIDRRLPGALIAMVASTILASAINLSRHGLPVLGIVAHSAPHFGLHGVSWSALGKLAPIGGVVALIVVTQSAATTRAFSDDGSGEVNTNRDFLGVGAGSILAGVSGAFPVNASPARTAVVQAASGRSQMAGLIAAGGVIALMPATGLLKNLPLAALAGTLVYVAIRLFRVQDLAAIARFSRVEFGLSLVTLLTVALIGVEQGIGVAVGLAILDRTRLSAGHHLHLLGRIPGSTSWTPLLAGERTEQVQGVLVLLFAAPLWYANADHFRTEFLSMLAQAGRPIRLVVLDAIGMSDIDYTGCQSLGRVMDHLDQQKVGLAIARGGEHVHEDLARSRLLERIGDEHWYAAVDQAVTAHSEGPAGSSTS